MTDTDFSRLYDEHVEYICRRLEGSFEQRRILTEIMQYKLPNLLALLPDSECRGRVLEIGCATGELIGSLSASWPSGLVGVDISNENISSARKKFPHVDFRSGDYRKLDLGHFDYVILSDVLEHVPDDVQFLREAGRMGANILIKLPLEDCLQYYFRKYGPQDRSGHLRKYNLRRALELCRDANLRVVEHRELWPNDFEIETLIRQMRREMTGRAYTGGWATRCMKSAIVKMTTRWKWISHSMYASDFFALARPAHSRGSKSS